MIWNKHDNNNNNKKKKTAKYKNREFTETEILIASQYGTRYECMKRKI